MLREEDILFGLPVTCLHTQKKKTIKVRAYLEVDMSKNFAEKFKNLLLHVSQQMNHSLLVYLLKCCLVPTLHIRGKAL